MTDHRKILKKLRIEQIPGIAAIFYNILAAKGFITLYKKIAKEIVSKIKSGKILDIGTGPGYLPIEIAKLNNQLEITGIDLSSKMINIANKNIQMSKIDRVRFEVADAHNLPYENNTFNFVISTFSLHHWKNRAKVFKECRRVVKNNCSIWIYDFKRDAPRKEIKKTIISKSFYTWYLSWAIKFHGLKTEEWNSINNNFSIKGDGTLVCLKKKK